MNKKYLLKAMYFTLCISLLFSSTLYAKTTRRKDAPGTAIFVMAQEPDIQLLIKNYIVNKDYIGLNVKIPQISGLTDITFQKEINKKLLADAKQRKNEVINEAKTYNKDILKDGLKPLKFEYMESFNYIDSPSPYLTLEFFTYRYSGGAHGLSQLDYLTINTSQNTVVKLKDLFKQNVDYKAVINEEINRQLQIRMQQGEYFFTGNDGFIGIKEDQPFYINSSGKIVIVFNVYEIAPYAAGTIEIPIDKKILAPYFK